MTTNESMKGGNLHCGIDCLRGFSESGRAVGCCRDIQGKANGDAGKDGEAAPLRKGGKQTRSVDRGTSLKGSILLS